MSKGGVREGAGRKKMTDTVPVCWRISRESNEWIRKQAEEQGVTIAQIVDKLVKNFEEVVNGNIEQMKFNPVMIDRSSFHPYDKIDLYEAIIAGTIKKDYILKDYLLGHPDKVAELMKRFMGETYKRDSCRMCKSYDNDCPFLRRGPLMVYPNRPCVEYRRKSDLSLLLEMLN